MSPPINLHLLLRLAWSKVLLALLVSYGASLKAVEPSFSSKGSRAVANKKGNPSAFISGGLTSSSMCLSLFSRLTLVGGPSCARTAVDV